MFRQLKEIPVSLSMPPGRWFLIIGSSVGVIVATKAIFHFWHHKDYSKSEAMAEHLFKLIPTYNASIGEKKSQFFSSLKSIESADPNLAKEGKFSLLEIGVGTGANFQYYPKDIQLYLSDPNPHVEKYLEKSLQEAGITTPVKSIFTVATGEETSGKLGIEDGSIDVVVATLVMCHVENPENFLTEVHRVLRPGGIFFFWDHIMDSPWSFTWLLQMFLTYLPFFHAHFRRPHKAIQKAGLFARVDVEEFRIPRISGLPWYSQICFRPHALGLAYK